MNGSRRRPRRSEVASIAKMAAREALQQTDVVRLKAGIAGRLGLRRTSGVTVRADENGRFHIDVAVVVRYGADLAVLGPAMQQAILAAVPAASGSPIGQVNVRIADVERGMDELKQEEGCVT